MLLKMMVVVLTLKTQRKPQFLILQEHGVNNVEIGAQADRPLHDLAKLQFGASSESFLLRGAGGLSKEEKRKMLWSGKRGAGEGEGEGEGEGGGAGAGEGEGQGQGCG